jgi:hypothetical protein
VKLTNHLHVQPRIRSHGAALPLPSIHLWSEEGECALSVLVGKYSLRHVVVFQ